MSEYLWDRSGLVDPEIESLERRLQPLAFDPQQQPLTVPPMLPPRRRGFWTPMTVAATALAASVLFAVSVVGFHNWRLSWQDEKPWPVSYADGISASFGVGSPLHVGPLTARVDIARLGVLAAKPGADLEMNHTGPLLHRLTLNRGEIDVRVWAPPGRVAVHTPAGEVIDLGCIFSLNVADDGSAHLSVQTGWVNLQNAQGNSFIPAGASAAMFNDRPPQVPLYDDATDAFRSGVRALEYTGVNTAPSALRTIIADARKRDALTLLMLSDAEGLSRDQREALLTKLSTLFAGPSTDSVLRVINGNRDEFWNWHDLLPLPSLKNWWVNWRDAFPRR